MPIYEYKCKKGHVFDVMQSFSDEPLTKCEVCGAPVQRVYHPVSVHFKGSGFYNTDYGTKRRAREAKENKESSSGSSSDGVGTSSETGGSGSSSDNGSSKSESSSSSSEKKPAGTSAS
jgi:putative FmdB family regulatory protein